MEDLKAQSERGLRSAHSVVRYLCTCPVYFVLLHGQSQGGSPFHHSSARASSDFWRALSLFALAMQAGRYTGVHLETLASPVSALKTTLAAARA